MKFHQLNEITIKTLFLIIMNQLQTLEIVNDSPNIHVKLRTGLFGIAINLPSAFTVSYLPHN
jgi:hypothetical protein